MPRFIDADLAINDLCGSQCGCTINECGLEEPCEKARCILKQPTADVQEVKHGWWILDKEGTELVCSVCGGFAPLNYFKYHRVRSEYCPDCGARIDCKKEE